MAEHSKSDQAALLAKAMALRYDLLALFVFSQLIWNGSWPVSLDILWYSLVREVRCWDHHGLERGVSLFTGACEVSRVVSWVELMSNHLAGALASARVGQSRREKSSMFFLAEGQSIRAPWGVSGRSMISEGWTVTMRGT